MGSRSGALAAIVVALCGIGARAQSPPAERAFEKSIQRYQEWLGPASVTPVAPQIAPTSWPPRSMMIESQVAFEVARSWFAGVPATEDLRPLIDGAAWHLQSRVVEELFDLTWHEPGYRYDAVPLFGARVQWAMPTLVLSRRAREDRGPAALAHAASAFATLENLVGWPALAGALRVLAHAPASPPLGRDDAISILATATGISLDWFRAAIADPSAPLDDAIVSVETGEADCAGQPCFRTTVAVMRSGTAPGLTIPLRVDFGTDASSTFWWDGREGRKTFEFESGSAPSAVTLDPDRLSRLDVNPLNQRWRAAPFEHARPVKMLASWVVWLQHAALSYSALL